MVRYALRSSGGARDDPDSRKAAEAPGFRKATIPMTSALLLWITLATTGVQEGVSPPTPPPTAPAAAAPDRPPAEDVIPLPVTLTAPATGGAAPGDATAADPPSPAGPGRSLADAVDAVNGDNADPGGAVQAGQEGSLPVSGNPAAVNITTGTGALGRFLGLRPESGLRLGGLWIGDANGVLAGGISPGVWSFDSLTIVNFSIDTQKRWGLRGGLFGMQFLQFSGQPTNERAGAFPGYNSLIGPPPLVRQEIYQLWYRQSLFEDRLIIRMGKVVPTNDFGNVIRPVPVQDSSAAIPAVTGLIFTPVYINPTMIGVMPGYYNSAVGMTSTLKLAERSYFSYGIYEGDGAGVNGRQIGLEGPYFNGSSFQIGEIGHAYFRGPQKKPGNFGVGIWGQIGQLRGPSRYNPTTGDLNVSQQVTGAQGLYLFGAQRLWFRNPGRDNSGVSGFYQFGANNSSALAARQYVGGGLTAFGLVPGRPADSFGFGVAQTWLNSEPYAASRFFLTSAIEGDQRSLVPIQPAHVLLVLPVQGLRRLLLPAQPHLHPHARTRPVHPRRPGGYIPDHLPVLSAGGGIARSRPTRAPRGYKARPLRGSLSGRPEPAHPPRAVRASASGMSSGHLREGATVAPDRNPAQEPGPPRVRRLPAVARHEDPRRRPARRLGPLDLQRGPLPAGARRARDLPPAARRPALSRPPPSPPRRSAARRRSSRRSSARTTATRRTSGAHRASASAPPARSCSMPASSSSSARTSRPASGTTSRPARS